MAAVMPEGFDAVEEYHKTFQNLNQQAIDAVKEIAGQGLWRLPDFEGFILLNQLAEKLNVIYQLPALRVELFPIEAYNPLSRVVGLPHVSLVSFLHEYRHHMRSCGTQHYNDVYKDVRGWSISLFRRACPASFKRSWMAGLIAFMPPYPRDEETGETDGSEL